MPDETLRCNKRLFHRRLENAMTEPQYYWQAPEKRFTPLHDIPDEEFDQRLEDMIQHLEALQKEAA
jgi:hypothetical protein